MKIYYFFFFGYVYCVVLFVLLLGFEVELIYVDLVVGVYKQLVFFVLNFFGQVLVLEDGDVVIVDFNVILVYLVKKEGCIDWLFEDVQGVVVVQCWLLVVVGELVYGLVVVCFVIVFGVCFNLEEVIQCVYLLLGCMEQYLVNCIWLVVDYLIIVDVVVYSYLVVVFEGNVDLSGYLLVLCLL